MASSARLLEQEAGFQDYIRSKYSLVPGSADGNDYEFVFRGKWQRRGRAVAMSRTRRYRVITVWYLGKQLLMRWHRVVWFLTHDEFPAPELHVDHINRDPSDNRPENLRVVTVTENQTNQRTRGVCASRGVTKYYRRFVAALFVGGKHKRIGSFASEGEAARAFDAYVTAHRLPQRAYLNFPEEIHG